MFRLLENHFVSFAAKPFCLIFNALIVSYYISDIAAAKKEKSEMSFKSIIGPRHSIYEIATSHIGRPKRLEM